MTTEAQAIKGHQRVGKPPAIPGHQEGQSDATTAFLEALFSLDGATAEAIMERAAIMEYEGGLQRQEAERLALEGAGKSMTAPDALDSLAPFLPLMPMTEEDHPLATWKGSSLENFIRTREELAACMEGKGDARGAGKGQAIARFGFIPGPAGLIVLDLDRNHKDGADGVAELLGLFAGRLLPSYFADLDQGSFPAFSRTPSGGFHLFFRYTGSLHYGPQTIAPGVEVAHWGKLITAPGSVKDGRRYIMAGTLEDAPPFPPFLEDLLRPDADHRPRTTPRPFFTPPPERGDPSLERIAQWATDDGDGAAGRNALAHAIARRASGYSYTRDQVTAFLKSYGPTSSLPGREIETAVNSAFNYRRKN